MLSFNVHIGGWRAHGRDRTRAMQIRLVLSQPWGKGGRTRNASLTARMTCTQCGQVRTSEVRKESLADFAADSELPLSTECAPGSLKPCLEDEVYRFSQLSD